MSDPNDVTRPRSPLTLSPKSPRPTRSDTQTAEKLYGKTSPSTAHREALAAALLGNAKPIQPSMTAAALAAASSKRGYWRFKLNRDRDRPLEFDGRVVAEVEEASFGGQVLMRAAIYQTQGGKCITEMTRRETQEGVDYGTAKRPYLFAKVAIFDNLDVAAMSFRTHGGKLTERLLRQIGDLDSEFIK